MLPRKDGLQPPELDKQGDGLSPGASRGSEALPKPRFQTCGLQNCEIINFCGFKPPSVWKFVTAVRETNTDPHLTSHTKGNPQWVIDQNLCRVRL